MQPKLVSRIGKTTSRKWIDGSPMVYRVLDEVVRVADIPKRKRGKALCLHLIEVERQKRKRKLMRLCYYMIGEKGRAKGKWVFGQFAPMMTKKEFQQIVLAAKKKNWI